MILPKVAHGGIQSPSAGYFNDKTLQNSDVFDFDSKESRQHLMLYGWVEGVMLSTAELMSTVPTQNSAFGNHFWPHGFYQIVGNKQQN